MYVQAFAEQLLQEQALAGTALAGTGLAGTNHSLCTSLAGACSCARALAAPLRIFTPTLSLSCCCCSLQTAEEELTHMYSSAHAVVARAVASSFLHRF